MASGRRLPVAAVALRLATVLPAVWMLVLVTALLMLMPVGALPKILRGYGVSENSRSATERKQTWWARESIRDCRSISVLFTFFFAILSILVSLVCRFVWLTAGCFDALTEGLTSTFCEYGLNDDRNAGHRESGTG